ncbi:AP endonuclease (DNA-[apurinic or apyrimidinic site] lyase) [Plasmodium vivax Mauritania I]|uniref:DNA-(apurinic or apyrimidinic site) endonuclease n=1 Tax=Plasmodium vivax Mauritania I TaxID=1035515 RepID=A0A0J9TEL6_PLAVI|nr:AP endonuclease (DNA-[apurinic or apyrimidinic site] lyase) [Plasmodium vivax Mauritania I]
MLRARASLIPRCIELKRFSIRRDVVKLVHTQLPAQHLRALKACTGQVKMLEEIQSSKRKQVEEGVLGESCERVKRTKLVPIGGEAGLAAGEKDASIKKEATNQVKAEDDPIKKEATDQVKTEQDDPAPACSSTACAAVLKPSGSAHSGEAKEEEGKAEEDGEAEVKTIVTWNMNSITVRYKNKDKWNAFMSFFNRINADVLCFQEVRLPALNLCAVKNSKEGKRDRGKVKNTDQKSQVDFDIMSKILKKDFHNYNAYFSLANIKYSGQLVLIKRNIPVKSIRYNLRLDADPSEHHEEGRVIIAEFSKFYLLSTYTPNNGFDTVKFERRRLFDEQLKKFVSHLRNMGKNLIWTGDLNIAPEDIDLSHPAEFRRMKKGNVPKEFVGQPGCTDFERKNFMGILSAGDLVDSYRQLAGKGKAKKGEASKGETNKGETNKGETSKGGSCNGGSCNGAATNGAPDINDNIYTWRCPFLMGKSCNKAMRIDHFIVSRGFMPNVQSVDIHGYSVFHKNFYGSDHCPVILHLRGGEAAQAAGEGASLHVDEALS